MSQSINERFMDFQVAQQVRWIRYQNKEVAEALKILNRVDARLATALRRADPGGAPYTQARLRALRAQVTELINTLHNDELAPVLMENLTQASVMAGDIEEQAFRRIMPAGVDVTTPNLGVLQVAATLKPFNGANMKEWTDQLRLADLNRSWRAIVDGITSGTTTDDLIRQLVGSPALRYKDGVREVSRRGLEALVRTSINHATNQGRQVVWDANQDIIRGVRWVSTLDTRTTPICQHRDGRVGPVSPTEGWTPPEGSLPLDPPMARPPAHLNCRSTTVAVTKSWKELGFDVDDLPPATRASMDGQVPANVTYFDWLKRQSAGVQKEVLGPARFDMWHKGGIAPEKFVNDAGERLTLAQLRAAFPESAKILSPSVSKPTQFTLDSKNGGFGSWQFEKFSVGFIDNPMPVWDAGLGLYDALGKRRFSAAWDKAFKQVELDPAKLTTIQGQLNKVPDVIPDFSEVPPIKVAKLDGNLIVLDGNHRAAALWIQGERRILANVIDLDDPANAKLIDRSKLGTVKPPKLPVVRSEQPQPQVVRIIDSPDLDLTSFDTARATASSFLSRIDNLLKLDPRDFGLDRWPSETAIRNLPGADKAAFLGHARMIVVNTVEGGQPKRYQTYMRKIIEKHGLMEEPRAASAAVPSVSARVTTEMLRDIHESRANGYSITTDGLDIEDHNLLIHREYDLNGRPRMVATFKVTEGIGRRIEESPEWTDMTWRPTIREVRKGNLYELDETSTPDGFNAHTLRMPNEGATITKVSSTDRSAAARNLVRIEVPGDDLLAVENIFAAVRRMGIDSVAPTKADRELLYLVRVGTTNRNVWKGYEEFLRDNPTANTTTRLGEIRKLLKTNWPDFFFGEYQDMRQSVFGYGRVYTHRLDWLNDPLWSEFERDYRLSHSWTFAGSAGGSANFFDMILNSGGALVSLTERLRRGISASRSASWGSDMRTGGGDYFFTRIRRRRGIYEKPGMVFKARLAARTDAISYDHDAYGQTNDRDFINYNRAKSVRDLMDRATHSSNETILKGYQTIFDDVDHIVVHANEVQDVIETFRKHKIDRWPDGRNLEEVIVPVGYRFKE